MANKTLHFEMLRLNRGVKPHLENKVGPETSKEPRVSPQWAIVAVVH